MNKSIKKKLDGQTFIFDETSFDNRGYWYLYQNNEIGRAATKEEYEKLGRPEQEEKPEKKKPKPFSYQKSARIRQMGITKLITQRIVSGDSVAGAIKNSISDKTKANVRGIQEKLDPLNIAKILTGGGALAPAILGRLTGRKQRDIEYFTGRSRQPVDRNTSDEKSGEKSVSAEPFISHVSGSKITPIAKGDSVADSLSKLYGLLRQNYDENKKRKQLEKDFDEEKEEEAQKRHEALLKALGMIGVKGGNNPTINTTQPQQESFFDKIKSLFGKVTELFGLFGELKNLFGVFGGLSSAGKIFGFLARFLVGPVLTALSSYVVLGFLAATAIGGGLYYLISHATPEEAKAATQGYLDALDPASESRAIIEAASNPDQKLKKKMNILKDRSSDDSSYLFLKDPELQEKYLKKIGWDEKTGTTKQERDNGIIGIDPDGNPIRKITLLPKKQEESATQMPSSEITSSVKPNVMSNSIEKTSPVLSTDRLNSVQKENTDLKTDESVTVTQPIIMNNTKNSNKNTKPKQTLSGESNVRNPDESLNDAYMMNARPL